MTRKTVFILGSVGIVLIIGTILLLTKSRNATSPTSLSVVTTSTLTTFTPTDAQPLDFAPNGQFFLAAPPASTTLYQIGVKAGIGRTYAVPHAVASAAISPDEQYAVLKTAEETSAWLLLNLSDGTITTLENISIADWFDSSSLVVITKDKKVGRIAVGTRIITPFTKQPDLSKTTQNTLQSVSGQVLIGSTIGEAELPLFSYSLITVKQELIENIVTDAVWATLTPDGAYLMSYNLSEKPLQYIAVADRSSHTLDAAGVSFPIIGSYNGHYVTLAAAPTTGEVTSWQITLFSPGTKPSTTTIAAPVSWHFQGAYIAHDILYAYGDGLLYHSNMSNIVKSPTS